MQKVEQRLQIDQIINDCARPKDLSSLSLSLSFQTPKYSLYFSAAKTSKPRAHTTLKLGTSLMGHLCAPEKLSSFSWPPLVPAPPPSAVCRHNLSPAQLSSREKERASEREGERVAFVSAASGLRRTTAPTSARWESLRWRRPNTMASV